MQKWSRSPPVRVVFGRPEVPFGPRAQASFRPCHGPKGLCIAYGLSRTTSEPPCHDECATYSACACPFLAHPKQRRRENNLPEADAAAGLGFKRNPGVALVWTTRSYKSCAAPWDVEFDKAATIPDGQ